jgi:hypothetical protein
MDESGSTPVFPNVRTPEDVFRDFRGRRAGILKALTTGTSLSFPRSVLDLGIGFVAHGFALVCLAVSVVRRCGAVLQDVRPR